MTNTAEETMDEEKQRRKPPKRKGKIGGTASPIVDNPLDDDAEHTLPVSPLVGASWPGLEHPELEEPSAGQADPLAGGDHDAHPVDPEPAPEGSKVARAESFAPATPDLFASAPQFSVSKAASPDERLAEYERIIQGAQAAVERVASLMRNYTAVTIGLAMIQIREEQLVPNLEEYGWARWQYKRPHLYRMIDLGIVVAAPAFDDVQHDWTYRQSAVLAPIIKRFDDNGKRARQVWDQAVANGDTSDRGLKTAQAMKGLGAPAAKELTGNLIPPASPRVESDFKRYQAALASAKAARVRGDADRRRLAEIARLYPEGAGNLVLDLREAIGGWQEMLNELECDVDDDILIELQARRAGGIEEGHEP